MYTKQMCIKDDFKQLSESYYDDEQIENYIKKQHSGDIKVENGILYINGKEQ